MKCICLFVLLYAMLCSFLAKPQFGMKFTHQYPIIIVDDNKFYEIDKIKPNHVNKHDKLIELQPKLKKEIPQDLMNLQKDNLWIKTKQKKKNVASSKINEEIKKVKLQSVLEEINETIIPKVEKKLLLLHVLKTKMTKEKNNPKQMVFFIPKRDKKRHGKDLQKHNLDLNQKKPLLQKLLRYIESDESFSSSEESSNRSSKRKKKREKSDNRIKKRMKQVEKKIFNLIKAEFKESHKKRKKKSKLLQKYLKQLKKQHKKDLENVKDLLTDNMIDIDKDFMNKLQQIEQANKKFQKDPDFRDMILNGTLTTIQVKINSIRKRGSDGRLPIELKIPSSQIKMANDGTGNIAIST